MDFNTDHTSDPASRITTLQGSSNSVTRMMQHVLLALLPGIAVMFYFFGWGVFFNLLLATLYAIAFEAIVLALRKRPIDVFLKDYSAIVSAWLLALSLPAYAPWWLIGIAVFFTIVIAKQLYGGLGYNPFNPAMVGYAAVLVSFPVEMTTWFTPQPFMIHTLDFWDSFSITFNQVTPFLLPDGITSATILDILKTELRQDSSLLNITQSTVFGSLSGYGWETINAAFLLGGAWLLYKKVISWHIPTAMLASLATLAFIFWLIDPSSNVSPLFHLLAGGTMLGAFFIATDPISASTTPQGKLIYAALIGFFIYVIRVWGSGYPDGIAFAVIIMNMAVPMLDYYTRPKTFGRS